MIAVEDATDGALRLLELVDELVPDMVSSVMGLPPLLQERTTLWFTPADQDLHRILALDRFAHDVTTQRVHAGQLHVTIVNAATGEILRDLIIDPRLDYQPTGRPPGPTKK